MQSSGGNFDMETKAAVSALKNVAVFEKLKLILDPVFPFVRYIMSDFEQAIWKAVKQCFPDFKHTGCCFHWTQAVMKKVIIRTFKKSSASVSGF